ncbi:hypothetical protein NIES3974_40490 [Calothrix sp. NIES-3974]|nr:hypothetical protein NIES3974_40490 [Calothrix sp. NIES-3974]
MVTSDQGHTHNFCISCAERVMGNEQSGNLSKISGEKESALLLGIRGFVYTY